jgi:hypothetical protein
MTYEVITTKKNTMLIIAAAVMALTSITASAEGSGFSGEDRLITAASAPHDNKYTEIQWGGNIKRENCGVPITDGERLLLPCGDKLLALDEKTGAELSSTELPGKCSEEYAGAKLGASLLLPLENGAALINTDSLVVERCWSFGGDTASDCAIIDKMGYFAVEYDESWEFICIDLDSDSTKKLWGCVVKDKPSAAAVQGDNIIFAAGENIYTHHYKDSTPAEEIPVGKKITGSPFATEYAVFISTEDGNAGKFRLNSDGTYEEDTLTFCKVGASPSSPLSWNGRLYVAADDGFYILDNLNMEVSYVLNDIKGGCTPQVHYGSGPYIYTVAPREDRWAVYCVRDMDEESEPTYAILAQMENFSRGAFCASAEGTLYFLDAVGRVYALTIAPFDVMGLIIRLVVLLALMALVFIWFKKMADRRASLRPKY